MSEPTVIRLTHTGAAGFTGVDVIDLTRDDFTVVDQRYYSATIQAGGVVPADFWGLFRSSGIKLVSVAAEGYSAISVARVGAGDGVADVFREEVDLTPTFQSVLMTSNDILRLSVPPQAAGSGERAVVTLVVNTLNERQAADFAKERLQRQARHSRYAIRRTDQAAFALNTAVALQPVFTYDESSQTMLAETDAQGYVSLREIAAPGASGVYLWFRFTGIAAGAGDVFNISARTAEENALATGLTVGVWSDPFWFSRDDRFGVRSTAPAGDLTVGVEIAVSPPSDRRI